MVSNWSKSQLADVDHGPALSSHLHTTGARMPGSLSFAALAKSGMRQLADRTWVATRVSVVVLAGEGSVCPLHGWVGGLVVPGCVGCTRGCGRR